jgi:hypothetical protein
MNNRQDFIYFLAYSLLVKVQNLRLERKNECTDYFSGWWGPLVGMASSGCGVGSVCCCTDAKPLTVLQDVDSMIIDCFDETSLQLCAFYSITSML